MNDTDTKQIQDAEVIGSQPTTSSQLVPRDLPKDLPITRCPHNLDLSTRKGKALLLAAGNPADIVVDPKNVDEQGRPCLRMIVHNYLIYPDEFTDPDSGEITEGVRCVFFDGHGRTFKTSAAHGPSRIRAMLDLFTVAEWQDGIGLVITERKSRNPKRQSPYHDIRLAD